MGKDDRAAETVAIKHHLMAPLITGHPDGAGHAGVKAGKYRVSKGGLRGECGLKPETPNIEIRLRGSVTERILQCLRPSEPHSAGKTRFPFHLAGHAQIVKKFTDGHPLG